MSYMSDGRSHHSMHTYLLILLLTQQAYLLPLKSKTESVSVYHNVRSSNPKQVDTQKWTLPYPVFSAEDVQYMRLKEIEEEKKRKYIQFKLECIAVQGDAPGFTCLV